MATTQSQNERLTQIGPGTPMGNLLRRYWHPIGAAIELDVNPVKAVRFFGEDLTLRRDTAAGFSLTAAHTGYPVQELGGLLFAYLGPQPAPLLPRWDILVQDDLDRAVEIVALPCNWLQCMDNSVDPVHFEFLHARFGNYERARLGKPPMMDPAQHLKIAFDLYRFGIMKRRLLEGASEDCDDWTTGHPLIFPNLLAVGQTGEASFQYRIPVDDVNTIQIGYRTIARRPGAEPKPITVRYLNLFDAAEPPYGDTIPKQDFIAWVAQGPIADRTQEHLTAGDTGVILYHKLLEENMKRVERGEDPIALVRDPAENEPMIRIPREHARLEAFAVKDKDSFKRARELAQVRG
jgi:5,5'-dehydrodivanillate O-demethylase oxygenase subunit